MCLIDLKLWPKHGGPNAARPLSLPKMPKMLTTVLLTFWLPCRSMSEQTRTAQYLDKDLSVFCLSQPLQQANPSGTSHAEVHQLNLS